MFHWGSDEPDNFGTFVSSPQLGLPTLVVNCIIQRKTVSVSADGLPPSPLERRCSLVPTCDKGLDGLHQEKETKKEIIVVFFGLRRPLKEGTGDCDATLPCYLIRAPCTKRSISTRFRDSLISKRISIIVEDQLADPLPAIS